VTSPIAARHSVAAGIAGTQSIRSGGGAVPVQPIPAEIEAYFLRDQVRTKTGSGLTGQAGPVLP
jgi:hypothetical protein